MDWVEARAYAAAAPDPLSEVAPGIVEHMNRDHADALALFARVLAGEEADEATMLEVDRLGFKLRLVSGGRLHTTRIAFAREVRTAADARTVLIEMVGACRARGRRRPDDAPRRGGSLPRIGRAVYDARGARRMARHNRRFEGARRRPCGASETGVWMIVAVLIGSTLGPSAADAQKKTLVVALNQDPDILDPTLSRTYVGRIIYAQMCEKLYDIDESLKIFPQLAAELPAFSDGGKTVTIKLRPGVKFNDGTPMNAEAVRFSLDRHLNMKGSNRRSELDSVTAIEVVDPLTVRLKLKAPFSPLVAMLADRAGMPVSPAQANKLGDKFGTAPVCVGPWSFVERVPQDRIVLEKSPHYFDPGQARFDRLVFRIIPDDNVRLANLRSGDIDFMHLVGPTDAQPARRKASSRSRA